MRFLFSKKPRALFDVDSGNGSGGTPPPADPGTTPNPDTGKQPKNPPSDPEAAKRWAWQQNREKAQNALKENEQLKAELAKHKPTFDAENDPEGKLERQWEIEQAAGKLLSDKMKELGIEDTLGKIQYEKEEAQFFEVVNTEAAKFKALGIDAPSKEELKTILTTIDEKGITPEQIILLSKAQQIIERLKPGGFTPGSGNKPSPQRTQSAQELREALYSQHGAFGRG